uniref:Uncharacterized protein n=1 Tax=Arundo donax TaxID=35708 RepID=A0A0A9D354_ARUDO
MVARLYLKLRFKVSVLIRYDGSPKYYPQSIIILTCHHPIA